MLGMMYASVFITVAMITLFLLLKRRALAGEPTEQRRSPMAVALTIVAMSYPAWAFVGGVLGVLYGISAAQMPGAGFGSPNLFYTLSVAAAAVLTALPLVILRRDALLGVLALALVFIGIFGWLLPYFVA